MSELKGPPGVEIDAMGNAMVNDQLSTHRRLLFRMVKTENLTELYIQIEQDGVATARVLVDPKHARDAIMWAEARGPN